MDEAGVSHGVQQREAAPLSAKAFCAENTEYIRVSRLSRVLCALCAFVAFCVFVFCAWCVMRGESRLPAYFF